MKKILNVLFALMMLVSLVGCSKSTTVANEDEWKALFTNKENKKVTVYIDEISEENIDETVEISGNVIKTVTDNDDYISEYYTIKNEDDLTINHIYSQGEGVYTQYEDVYETIEELNEDWDYTATTSFAQQVCMDMFADAKYDEQKKCYCVGYEVLDGMYDDFEIYVENKRIVKEINTVSYEDYSYKLYFVYEYVNSNIELPTIKDTVDSKEEWDSLFDVNKYKNCTSYLIYYDIETIAYINPDAIEVDTFAEDATFTTLINKTDDTKVTIREVEYDEDFEIVTDDTYDIEYDDELVTCFEDFIVANSIGRDYSDYYEDAKYAYGYYVFDVPGDGYTVTTSLKVSNGYIVEVLMHSLYQNKIEFEQHITLESFNQTSLWGIIE